MIVVKQQQALRCGAFVSSVSLFSLHSTVFEVRMSYPKFSRKSVPKVAFLTVLQYSFASLQAYSSGS